MPSPDQIPVSLNLADPDTGSSGPIGKIIDGHLQSRGRAITGDQPPIYTFWDAEFFGLHKVRLFRDANPGLKARILDGCARTVLNESYFIEKSGMAYCAKMILLSDSVQVEQVYGLIAADEAAHLNWVRPYVAENERGRPEGDLLNLIGELIERCDPNSLAYLVQVILEGWGLHHYKALAKSCRQPELQKVFQSIARDEAMHHHTGEVVFDPNKVTGSHSALISDSLRRYTEMVRVGPQAVVRVLDREFGGLDLSAKIELFSELETEGQSAEKLELLRGLMSGPGRESYLAELDEKGAFTPYSPESCAAIHG